MCNEYNPITSRAYVIMNGTKCPICLSSNINSDHLEPDGDVAWANCDCDNCGATWTDYWKLIGYDNLEREENE